MTVMAFSNASLVMMSRERMPFRIRLKVAATMSLQSWTFVAWTMPGPGGSASPASPLGLWDIPLLGRRFDAATGRQRESFRGTARSGHSGHQPCLRKEVGVAAVPTHVATFQIGALRSHTPMALSLWDAETQHRGPPQRQEKMALGGDA